eukprot:CCRYP_005996-RA/>CCRYP_005996-RA protein AED:0.37 eAED:0.40 QI:0/0/0/1/1/1/2/0/329
MCVVLPSNHTTGQPIIGGNEIVPGSRPYLVALQGPLICGASLISPRAVMTAAHCLFNEQGGWSPPQGVVFNRHRRDDPTGETFVALANTAQVGGDVVPHPSYRDPANDFNFDVAILFLPSAMSGITPITLNRDPNLPAALDDPLEITGWGRTTDGGVISNVPRTVDLNYKTRKACTEPPFRWSTATVRDNMICAFGNQKAICHGDSGGPLVLGSPQGGPLQPFVQVGIASFVALPENGGCDSPNFPGVFTRVSSVASWVRSTVCTRVGELCDGNQPTQRPINRPTMQPTARATEPTRKPTVASKTGKATTMPIPSKSGKGGNSAKSHKD